MFQAVEDYLSLFSVSYPVTTLALLGGMTGDQSLDRKPIDMLCVFRKCFITRMKCDVDFGHIVRVQRLAELTDRDLSFKREKLFMAPDVPDNAKTIIF